MIVHSVQAGLARLGLGMAAEANFETAAAVSNIAVTQAEACCVTGCPTKDLDSRMYVFIKSLTDSAFLIPLQTARQLHQHACIAGDATTNQHRYILMEKPLRDVLVGEASQ